jgi:hypothetical protein
MPDTPIACTLTSAQLRARRAATAELARRSLRSRRTIDGGALLHFAADPGTEPALRDVVAAEAQCCPFLDLRLRRAGDTIELSVTGPDAAQPVIAALFA